MTAKELCHPCECPRQRVTALAEMSGASLCGLLGPDKQVVVDACQGGLDLLFDQYVPVGTSTAVSKEVCLNAVDGRVRGDVTVPSIVLRPVRLIIL